MSIDKILPYKKFSNQDEWKDDSTYDKMRQVDLVGFSFYLGEIRLLNTAHGFHSLIGVSSIDDYDQYGLQSLGNMLHDYVMNLYYPYPFEAMEELNKKWRIMLQYFDIPTDKESYRDEQCTITGIDHYYHIESGIRL